MEDEKSSGDVIDQEVVEQEKTEDTSSDVIAEGEAVETPAEPVGQKPLQQEQPKAQDDYWKNRAMELERKTSNTNKELEEIKSILQQNSQQSQPQYTTEQLEDFLLTPQAQDDPNSAMWAKKELRRLRQIEQEQREKKLLESFSKQQEAKQTRQQAEASVVNDPRFAEAFIETPNGKQWNTQSKLAQSIGQYMADPRLKDQPDAIAIAARLAYADLAAYQQPESQQQLQSLKRQNAQLKTQTLTEGAGKNYTPPKKDTLSEKMSVFTSTKGDNTKAGQEVVKEYFRKKAEIQNRKK